MWLCDAKHNVELLNTAVAAADNLKCNDFVHIDEKISELKFRLSPDK